MSAIKKSMITAVCLALCVVLPQAFHSIPNAGAIYCPIHIPVLLCGLICGWKYGLLCGVAGPVFSSLFTGMPAVAYLPPMMIECAVYGAVSGVRIPHFLAYAGKAGEEKEPVESKTGVRLYIRLILAMLAGRVVSGIVKALIFSPGSYTMTLWVTGYFLTSLPGIVIQLVLIPAILYMLRKSAVIPDYAY